MELSVVILNYNVCDFLRQCILTVQVAIQDIDAEIIVIDNNSLDNSCSMVKKEFPELLLIENKDNIGFGRANNQAVTHAKGKYVCILNPDTAVAPDVFLKCLDWIKQTPDCGAIGARLIDGTGKFLPESKRNLPTPRVSLGKLSGSKKPRNAYYVEHVSKEEIATVSVLVGAFMFMKRKLYEQVGGFDKDYFMYGEDIDLSYKIEKAGFKNYYLGAALVLHYKGESTQRDKQYLDRFYGAMHIFYKKHFSKNFLFDSMIGLGIHVSKISKRITLNKKRNTLVEVESIYVLSKDPLFIEKLKIHYSQPIYPIEITEISKNKLENTMLIFDANYYDYSVILHTMQLYSQYNLRYRIRPFGTQQIIGSDRSDEKGSVLKLE